VQTLSGGDVLVRGPGGSDRFFTKNISTGAYSGIPGDYGKLTLSAGAYRLVAKDGTLFQFRTDGLLDYVEDTNGNRISFAYGSGKLISMSHSNGDQILTSFATDPPSDLPLLQREALARRTNHSGVAKLDVDLEDVVTQLADDLQVAWRQSD
jgi:hypothetical protein